MQWYCSINELVTEFAQEGLDCPIEMKVSNTSFQKMIFDLAKQKQIPQDISISKSEYFILNFSVGSIKITK